jgi:ABC-type Zn uptake system ZnuABC Zn-binding protein ZnuA
MGKALTLGSLALVAALGLGACGSDSDSASGSSSGDVPRIVVTTNILGDIVGETVGDLAEVEVIMPLGADPHDFAPSAQQAEAMENADLLVVNGAGFEEGMLDVIDNVADSGTPLFAFTDHVELLEFTDEHSDEDGHGDEEAADEDDDHSDDAAEGEDDDHGDDEDHGDEEDHGDDKAEGDDDEHGEDHGDEHDGGDPHIWTDPSRMATAVQALAAELAEIDGIDPEAIEAQAEAYQSELMALDAEMEETLAAVAADQRVMVTNHEVFGYFADRFGFEIVGAVVPSLTTNAEASAAEIEELASLIELEGIPAIFAETTQSTQLAEAIAESVGSEVAVVELFTESLGEDGSGAETYILMMSTNAGLVADALT